MKKIISIFIKYPFYANLTIAVIILSGILGLSNMKLSFFPERSSKEIFISVVYPGASPQEMEEGVTMKIEEAMRSVVGIKEVNSTSSENAASIQITIKQGQNIDDVLVEVKNAVDGIPSFPVDAEKPIVFKRRSTTSVAFLSLTGKVDLLTLKRLADEIENDFLNSGSLSQLSISGIPELEISIETREEDLLRYNISFADIMLAVSSNNIDLSSGLIRSGEEEVLIRARNRTVNPDMLGNIVVRADQQGKLLFLRDVADIHLQFAEGPGESYMNGNLAVSFQILKLPEEDLATIDNYLNQYISSFNQKHPEVKLIKTFGFISNLKARLSLLLNNGGIGLLLVLLSLGLFMSFRLAAWVAWGIPASFLGMFLIAAIAGITINMISLFGMLLIIGILVDDGIVIAENIFSHFEAGKSPARAAIDGTMEVIPAVTTSIATTMVAFSPLFFVEGQMEMMKDVAFIVVVSLAVSLIEAFFILPAHIGNKTVLRNDESKTWYGKQKHKIEKLLELVRDRIYGRLLRKVIRYRLVFLSIPVGLVLITIGLIRGGYVNLTFFPSIPFDQFNIDLAFKPGIGEDITDDYLARFEEAVWDVNGELKAELQDSVNFVDYTFRSVGGAFNGEEIGSHAGNIFVLLRDLENTSTSSFEIVNRVQEKIGKLPEAEKFVVAGRSTFGDPISVSLLGNNMNELAQAKTFLEGELQKIDAINNISDNNVIGKQEVVIKLKPEAYILGLNYGIISNQIRYGFFGGQAQRIQSGRDELRLWVRYPQNDREALGQLEAMKIKTANGGEYSLSSLVDYEISRGPVAIKRYNGSREIRVTAQVKDPNEPVVPITEKIKNEIVPQLLVQYPGVRVDYLGQQKESRESGESLGKTYMIAFLLMMLIIVIQLKSVAQMLIIMLMIPLAVLGAIWGHGLEGIPISMLSVWGIVALTGVIINDAIVFISKFNLFIKEGFDVKEAVFKAGISRFRAILLTTITTTLGLYPLILEKSFQAQFLIPLAVSLAYGVFVGTIFILIFFPAIIMGLNDFNRAIRWLWTGRKPEAREVEIAYRHLQREKSFNDEEL